MKILLTIFEIQDYGGIVGDVEFLAKGFKEHGHTVDLVILRPTSGYGYIRKPFGPKGSYPSEFGGEVNTLSGWYGVQVLGYAGKDNIRRWQDYANGYDLVIHEIPNPKHDEFDWWKQVYDIAPPQIIAAHDAHFRDMYPYINEIADKIVAITCTNHAGYVALGWCSIPRAFIGAAHRILDWTQQPVWKDRLPQAVCAHVWKAWKQMHTVVEAAPHLTKSFLQMGGDGIEGRYMRSKDKCKPRYKGIWDAAFGPDSSDNASYRGLMTANELRRLYQNSRVMVDMSFSRKFYALGNHFNRSILEAANNGCISICTSENMRENNPQVPLFKDGVTHIAVNAGIDGKELAEVIDWACNLPEDAVAEMLFEAKKVLTDHFDYKRTSLQYLELAQGKSAGIYPVLETGKMP